MSLKNYYYVCFMKKLTTNNEMRIMFLTLIAIVIASYWGAFHSNWNVDAQMGSVLIFALSVALVILAIVPKKKINLEK